MKLYYQDCGTYIAVAIESDNPEEILKWAKEKNLVSIDEHYQYLVKEMKKAVKAIKTNTKYVQE